MSRRARWTAGILAAAVVAGSILYTPAVSVQAKAPYDTYWNEQYPWIKTMTEALQKNTDATAVYREIRLALRYQVINELNIYQLYLDPTTVFPIEAATRLYQEGLISPVLYKLLAGIPLTAADMKDVFDPAWYYGAYPAINQVLPYDENVLFENFLNCGIPAGLNGNAAFNLAIYKANYPELVKAFGDYNPAYYQYYILFGKKAGQKADRRIN